MKRTVKVSIGGLAYIVEEDAYVIIDNYLKSLRNHFANKPEANEIIADIESRMSELLSIRNNNNLYKAISIEDAQEIIKIMGNPKDFGYVDETLNSEQGSNTDYTQRAEYVASDKHKKKLYRDIDDRIVGGVCSGLSHYSKIDPIVLRLLFVIPLFVSMPFGMLDGLGFSSFILYIVLWAIMPKAATFAQRLAMTGTNPSIDDIETRGQETKKYWGSSIPKALRIILNIILVFVILFILLVSVGSVSAIVYGIKYHDILNLLPILGIDNYISILVYAAIVILFPIISIIYLIVKAIRRSKFTRGSLLILAGSFFIWLFAIILITFNGISIAKDYNNNASESVYVDLAAETDTLYVKIDDSYINSASWFDNAPIYALNSSNIYALKSSKEKKTLFYPPKILVRQDSVISNFKMEVEKAALGSSMGEAYNNLQNADLDYTLVGSTLIIKPRIYTATNTWDKVKYKVVIATPLNKTVIVDKKLEQLFGRNPWRRPHAIFDFD